MKQIIFSIAFFTCSVTMTKVFAGDTLYWNSPLRLTWEDFKGKVGRSPSGTGSFIGVDYDLVTDKSSIKTKVTTYFLRGLSWAKNKNSDTLLQHEQLRFDLAELYARKLRKAFSQYTFKSEAEAPLDIKKIFSEMKEERMNMNDLYNRETKFGTDWTAQQRWANKISSDLDKLSDFANDEKK